MEPEASQPAAAPVASVNAGVDAPTTSGRGSPASGGDPVVVPTLDRDSFKQVLHVLGLRVPNRKCADLMKAFRGFTLDRPKLRCIVADGDSKDTKLLLLEEGVALEGLPAELKALVEEEGLAAVPYDVELGYGMLPADAVLKRLLPPGVDAPSSFETIGHIAHLNLRDEQLPYRHLIGAVLLDKNPHLRTIVNKLGSIENEFRVFAMEVIAGERRLETEVTQHGSRFRLDFSQVYWNSRLESEHLRLVSSLPAGGVLVDMMAGIGPFAVPAAQKGLTVYANDLNPASAAYCALNARLNRLGPGLRVFNMDGRAFLRLLCDTPGGPAAELRAKRAAEAAAAAPVAAAAEAAPASAPAEAPAEAQPASTSQPEAAADGGAAMAPAAAAAGTSPAAAHPAKRQRTRERVPAAGDGPPPAPPAVPEGFVPPEGGLLFDAVVMNLPASAIEFLDAFSGAFSPATWAERPLPMVHCYTFKRATETEADILAKAERYLGGALESGSVSVHTVRDVAPNKIMLCLSFRVPRAVAFKGRE